MSEEYRFKDRIKDIINGDVDYDKLRKAEKQGWIDRADTGFLRRKLLGNFTGRYGFPPTLHKMQSSGNGTSKNRREKFSWIFVNFSCNCLPSVL